MFGIGTELRDTEWRGVVRQLLAQGLLAVEGDYGTLVLTDASCAGAPPAAPGHAAPRAGAAPEAAQGGARRAEPARQPARRRPRRPSSGCGRWRAATAKEQGVPAYVIFHDSTLREIATTAPSSLAELGKVSGIGETKLARYGQQVLDALGA